ncbi:hypothetical protein LguiB_001764 [Lonicera macranthoides]
MLRDREVGFGFPPPHRPHRLILISGLSRSKVRDVFGSMESSKRTMVSQANDGLSPKRPKNSVSHIQTSKALNANSSSQSEASVPSQYVQVNIQHFGLAMASRKNIYMAKRITLSDIMVVFEQVRIFLIACDTDIVSQGVYISLYAHAGFEFFFGVTSLDLIVSTLWHLMTAS